MIPPRGEEMSKLTAKQEEAAIKFVECGNRSEAYRHAYDAENMSPESIKVEASRLFANPNVALTVIEIQEENRAAHKVTVESISMEYEEAREVAKSERQASAMVSASTGKAKLYGLVIDKASLNVTDKTHEEWLKQMQ